MGTHSNDGCTPIFLSVNVNVNNASPLTQAVLELLAFSLAGHFEITLGHRHMFWAWPYGHGRPVSIILRGRPKPNYVWYLPCQMNTAYSIVETLLVQFRAMPFAASLMKD